MSHKTSKLLWDSMMASKKKAKKPSKRIGKGQKDSFTGPVCSEVIVDATELTEEVRTQFLCWYLLNMAT